MTVWPPGQQSCGHAVSRQNPRWPRVPGLRKAVASASREPVHGTERGRGHRGCC